MQWLIDAGLIYKSCRISVPKLPLSGYCETNIFKIFLLDIGLLGAMSKISARAILKKNGLFSEYNGAFTENFIAQELSANQNPLYYWASEGIAEIDFIIENDLKIYPLEVKAGRSKRKKSLRVYGEKYHPSALLRTSLLNLKKDQDICNYPLYMVCKFPLLEC
jgi:predicted AAA+ superfamily ATPase